MDDRYLYFALSDPDFFDVPWARREADDIDLTGHVPDDWDRQAHGAWQLFGAPRVELPAAGWKIHLSVVPADAPGAFADLADTCVKHHVCFKTLRDIPLVRASHGKYAPQSLSDKVATAYPTSVTELVAVIDDLVPRLAGTRGPAVLGDLNHPQVPLGVRWGAYREHWVEAPDGRSVPGVEDLNGGVRPDQRRTKTAGADTCHPPPSEVQSRFSRDRVVESLAVSEATLLHRSNAGGVYRARLATGQVVVIKEARHWTGFDAAGNDAVTRLRHERCVLRHLSTTKVAPELVAYWERDDADFLVMEAIDGPNLSELVSRNHPRGRPDATREARATFDRWAAQIMANLRAAVGHMHDLGVAHGDLQPANVVVGADGLRLVDFEGARLGDHQVSRAIGTPGFICATEEPFTRDSRALDRIALMLEEPDALLLDRRPDLEPVLAARAPAHSATTGDWIQRLAEGILARATPERPDRLFPGGIEQFTVPLGGRNLLSGAAGVLLTLRHILGEVDAQHVDWLADLSETASTCRGFGEGIDGIAWALAALGRAEAAARIIDGVSVDAPSDLSWARGRAGVAVALAELSATLDRQDLRRRALMMTESVVRDVHDQHHRVRGLGLLEGWSGVCLALLRVADVLGLDLREAALEAARREIALLEPRGECLVATPNGRLRTGIGHGSGGAVLALAALGTDNSPLVEARRRAGLSTELAVGPVGGLLDGLAGDVLVLEALGLPRAANLRRDRCTWHCVPTGRGWSALGSQRLRCSDDLATGTAGVLLALCGDADGALSEVIALPIWRDRSNAPTVSSPPMTP